MIAAMGYMQTDRASDNNPEFGEVTNSRGLPLRVVGCSYLASLRGPKLLWNLSRDLRCLVSCLSERVSCVQPDSMTHVCSVVT
jgi:hypothetical protein